MLALEQRVALRRLEHGRGTKGARDAEQGQNGLRLVVEWLASDWRFPALVRGHLCAFAALGVAFGCGGVGDDVAVGVEVEGAALAVKAREAADDVEGEEARGVVEQAAEADGEVALQVLGMLCKIYLFIY